ncbi:MAG: gamma-glutamyl-gamma-aminobutyrate hydrolase family protein [Polyangiaceae bacterium]|nr:gamma-glutamyl-gamma-aminobutyrate hydrolase family protein [Polyangiaceae bacterium]
MDRASPRKAPGDRRGGTDELSVRRYRRRSKPPRIGVTGPDRGGFPAWVFTWLCLKRAGARAVHITPSHQVDLDRIDGLVIGGGADISLPLPVSFAVPPQGSRRRPRFVRPIDEALAILVVLFRVATGSRPRGKDRARDALELSLLDHADREQLPVLGICRGAQLMNVAAGGTLLWDLNTLYDERPQLYTLLPRRRVEIEKDSCLRRVLHAHSLRVNSLHDHAVGEPGQGMRVVAREATGVAQAIEHTGRTFWIGVQWHPEYLPQHVSHQRLFRALARAARGRPR